MPIAIFFLVFAGALIIAVLYRHLRVLALAVACLCGVLLAVITFDRVSESDQRTLRLQPGDIVLTDVEMIEDARYLKLSGWAENISALHRAREFDLATRLYDCATPETAFADCTIIGEKTSLARIDLPPGQARSFTAVVGFVNDFIPRGALRWDYEVTQVRATGDR